MKAIVVSDSSCLAFCNVTYKVRNMPVIETGFYETIQGPVQEPGNGQETLIDGLLNPTYQL